MENYFCCCWLTNNKQGVTRGYKRWCNIPRQSYQETKRFSRDDSMFPPTALQLFVFHLSLLIGVSFFPRMRKIMLLSRFCKIWGLFILFLLIIIQKFRFMMCQQNDGPILDINIVFCIVRTITLLYHYSQLINPSFCLLPCNSYYVCLTIYQSLVLVFMADRLTIRHTDGHT